jgi:putative methionine-R-sulfoxide reductase with GAF domain
MAAIFLLGTPTLWWLNGIFTEEGSIYLSILATGIISYGILYKKIKTSKKALEDLEKLKDSALNLESSTEGSFFDEDRFSHLVKSVIETEKDIKEMLNLTRKVINADSVTFFVLEGDNLVKKASAGDAGAKAVYPSEGYLLTVIKGGKPVIQSKLSGDSSYTLFSQKTGSSLCIPVLDGKVPLGVITAISSRIAAFSEHEKDITVSFALQIAEILRKARNYIEIERFAKGFKSLLETSKMLSASLRVEEIGDKLVELVSGMVSSSAVGFFLPDNFFLLPVPEI